MQAIDAGGNPDATPASRTWTIDTTAPQTTITAGPAQGSTTGSNSPSFSFTSSEPGSTFRCKLDNGAFASCTSPRAFTDIPDGQHTFTVQATDSAGNPDPSPATRTWTVDFDPNPPPEPGPTDAPAPGPIDPAPPNPSAVAPDLPESEATSVGEGATFLYEGASPIQDDVAAGAIDEQRTAVLRGRVTNSAGQPIVGARVTVLDEPALGRTATRTDGRYDIAVNGGGPVTLSFEREGFVPSQRLVEEVPWLGFADVDDVVLIPFDDKSNEIDLDSGADTQIAQSSVASDAEGTRRSTLLFQSGTDAVMELPDGSTEPLDEIVVRSTEYTVGNEQGLDAMPGQLPPTTAFTYAVDLSIDEAVEEGATEVRFDKPVVNYTDNFLDLPPGTDVPTGYYDRELGEWLGGPDGRVIAIVSESAGMAGVDVDGDGQADGAAKLAPLGIDDAERTRLASLYDPVKELWRVQVTHFTPWDYNYPYGPPVAPAVRTTRAGSRGRRRTRPAEPTARSSSARTRSSASVSRSRGRT